MQRRLTRHGQVANVCVQGRGTYGLGLTRMPQSTGHEVIEVNRPNWQLRPSKAKSDAVDAEAAVRSGRAFWRAIASNRGVPS